MLIETVTSQQNDDLCTAKVKITQNYSTKSNSKIFARLEDKIQQLRKQMCKKVVGWTPQIEKQSKQLNVKAIRIKCHDGGKDKAVLVAFGDDAKQNLARLLTECKAVEEETKGQASDIPDSNEGKP